MFNKRSIKTRAWLRLAHLRCFSWRSSVSVPGPQICLCSHQRGSMSAGCRSALSHFLCIPPSEQKAADKWKRRRLNLKPKHLGLVIEGSNSQWGQSVLAPWLWSFSSVPCLKCRIKTDCGRSLVYLIKHEIRLSNGHAAKIQRWTTRVVADKTLQISLK